VVVLLLKKGTAMNKPIDTKNTEANAQSLPRYEAPKIQAMSEKDILNSFQITQSMGAWWTVPTC
jgi:hypothetical protein